MLLFATVICYERESIINIVYIRNNLVIMMDFLNFNYFLIFHSLSIGKCKNE